ncbi:MAG: DegT/DnrJ/EryC1/StrS family aminotransferase, partial [bacterium]|nr:DegT/DnrJ/EryC1/StrS family aminotransferase [bacterium]
MNNPTRPKPPRISVAAPVLDGNERKYVLECIDTTWISSLGRFIGEFETAFAAYCGVKHAVAVNNGTTALHLALVALGIGPGDEVIVPSLTYIASANAVTYCGATPVLIDNDPRTFNLDPAKLEALITPRTKAIMPVHVYGQPVDMDPVMEIARRHGIKVVEDAAEAVGAKYKGRMTGSLGDCATFSFFGNKIITTGEGGMVTTDDGELAERLRLYRGQGMDPARRYWFPVVGYNYRMTNIQAAIGLAQLERVEHHLAARRGVAELYNAKLARLGNRLTLPHVEDFAEHVFWMYTVRLSDKLSKSRDQVMLDLDALGIETRPVFYPMHVMPPYEGLDSGPLPMADECAADGMNLPTHAGLTEADIDRIVDALDQVL